VTLEREFESWIIECGQRFGWRTWHVPAPMRPIGGKKFVPETRAKGLPDLFMLHEDPPRLIIAEVKGISGTLSPEQREFLRLAQGVAEDIPIEFRPIGVYVFKPGMEKAIEDLLRSKVIS
jgi:hypothetical protein